MHGLINRSIQNFVCASFGAQTWEDVTRHAGLDFTEFEAMLTYEDALTLRLLDALGDLTDRTRADLMEDIGTFLVTDPGPEGLRRLLRFGGVDFEDFLYSLDDLPDRVRLALPDLNLPRIELRSAGPHRYLLTCGAPVAGFGALMMGVLRVMADDFGALVYLEHDGAGSDSEQLTIELIQHDFTEGRDFQLGVQAG